MNKYYVMGGIVLIGLMFFAFIFYQMKRESMIEVPRPRYWFWGKNKKQE